MSIKDILLAERQQQQAPKATVAPTGLSIKQQLLAERQTKQQGGNQPPSTGISMKTDVIAPKKSFSVKDIADKSTANLKDAIANDKAPLKMVPNFTAQNFKLANKPAQDAQTLANALPAGISDAVSGAAITAKKVFTSKGNNLIDVYANNLKEDTEKRPQSFPEQTDSQVINQLGRQGLKGGAAVASDVLYGAGNMLPTIAANVVAPGSGYAVLGSGAFGNSYKKAVESGADENTALSYAAGSTILELTIEKATGGISGLGKGFIDTGIKTGIKKVVGKEVVEQVTAKLAKNPVALGLLKRAAAAVGEGFEEMASTALQPYLERATIDPNASDATAAELLYSGFVGFLTAAAIGAPQTVNDIRARQNAVQATPDAQNKPTIDKRGINPVITPTEQPNVQSEDMSATTQSSNYPKLDNERGFSANTRTNLNTDPILQQFVADDPDTYTKLANDETLQKSAQIYSQGYESAKSELYKAVGSRQLSPELIPLTVKLANQATQQGNVAEARQMISDVGEILTEYGQTIQAANILRRTDPMATADIIEKTVKKVNEAGKNKFGKQWKNANGVTDSEMQELSQIDIGDETAIQNFLEKVGKRIASEIPATVWEKASEFRKIAMLGNPKTQIKNFVANVPIAGERKLSNKVSAIIQNLFIDKADRTQKVFVGENSKKIASELYTRNLEILRGVDKWDLKQIIGQNRQIFKNVPLKKVREIVYGALERGDAPFLKSAFTDRAASYIAAQGYENVEAVPQKVVEVSTQEALKATFKDASIMSDFIQRFKRTGGVGGAALDVLMPFSKTPINLLRRSIDYSPLGIVKSIYQAQSVNDVATTIDSLSQGLTGTATIALGLLLAKLGVIIGSLDDDKDIAAMQKAEGIQKFSVTTPIGSISYGWASPFGTQLAVGSEVYKAYQQGENVAEALTSAVYAFGDSILSASVFQNIVELFNGYGSITENILQNTLADLPQQMIWSGLGQIARTIDPTVRTTYDNKDFANTQLGLAASKIPGLSTTQAASVDVWGKDVERISNPLLRTGNEIINPAYFTERKDNPLNDEVLKAYAATGDKDVFPKVAPYSFSRNGVAYSLNLPSRRMEYQRTMGQFAAKNVQQLIKLDAYKKLSAEGKAKAIKNIIEASDKYAKSQYIIKYSLLP